MRIKRLIASGVVRQDAVLISSTTPHSRPYHVTIFIITGDILLSPDGWVAANHLAGRVEGTVLSLT